ncbi:MAG: hypothetical protein AAF191_07170, partial [Verrucomicrobiota bacterium]
ADREKREVIFESFEDRDLPSIPRFPNRAGEWFGHLGPATPEAESKVKPFRGKHFAKFYPSRQKYSYAWHIIDLEEFSAELGAPPRQMEVAAAFYSAEPNADIRYQVRLAAFRQGPSEIRPIWNNEAFLYDTVLQHGGRNFVAEAGKEPGWKKLLTRLDIPTGSRSLVISLAVARDDGAEWENELYLDSVRARLIFDQRQNPESL